MKKLKINLTNQELLNASNVPGINAIKEAVWNSFDAEAEKIEINLLKQDLGAVEVITIEDNGIGFTTNKFKKNEGFGLTQIRARISNMRGNITISSTPNSGTFVQIKLPIKEKI